MMQVFVDRKIYEFEVKNVLFTSGSNSNRYTKVFVTVEGNIVFQTNNADRAHAVDEVTILLASEIEDRRRANALPWFKRLTKPSGSLFEFLQEKVGSGYRGYMTYIEQTKLLQELCLYFNVPFESVIKVA